MPSMFPQSEKSPAADGALCFLWPIVTHVVERPGVFDDEHRYPLRLVVVDEKDAADDDGYRIHDEKGDVEHLFVSRRFLVVGDVEKEIAQGHISSIHRVNIYYVKARP